MLRPQWPGNQPGLQRQLIQLDAQTHAHLQTLDPIQRAEYLSKLHKRNVLFRQQQQGQSHLIIIRIEIGFLSMNFSCRFHSARECCSWSIASTQSHYDTSTNARRSTNAMDTATG